MTGRGRQARAAMWLGAVAIASLVFLLPLRELGFVVLPKAAIPVLIVFGLLSVMAGWRGSRALTFVAAAGFLAAAVVQVVLQTAGAALAAGGNGSTFGLLLGLGAGMSALALTSDKEANGEVVDSE